SRILAECYSRSRADWGKAFSCYYSGNFTTGYRHGYVQKVFASWQRQAGNDTAAAIPVIDRRAATKPAGTARRSAAGTTAATPSSRVARRIEEARSERSAAPPVAAVAAPRPAAVAVPLPA